MEKHGFMKTPDGNYTNGKINVTDISPENIGYTDEEGLSFFDLFTYKSGGRMRNK